MIFANSGISDSLWKDLAYLAIFAGVLANGIYNMLKYQTGNNKSNGNNGNGHSKSSDKSEIVDILSNQNDHNVDIIDRLNVLSLAIGKTISLQERVLELQKELMNAHSETLSEIRNLTRVLSDRTHNADIAFIAKELKEAVSSAVTKTNNKKIGQ